MSERWLLTLEGRMKQAGARARKKKSKDSHNIWEFPDGHRIWLPSHGKHRRGFTDRDRANAEAQADRAITRHGVAQPERLRLPGDRPSDVETWAPLGPREESGMTAPSEPESEPAATAPSFVCDVCQYQATSHRTLVAHGMKHRAPRACPDCGKSFVNLGKHRAAGHPKSTRTTAPEPEVVSDVAAAATANISAAIKQAIQALENVRAYAVRLEEENKVIRRELKKELEWHERMSNLIKSAP